MIEIIDRLFTFRGTAELLHQPFVHSALIAAALLGLLAGLLAPLIVSRGMAFAVHGTSELAFTGGAAALVLHVDTGLGAVVGAVLASVVFGVLGLRQRERDSVIGVVLAFGLGIGVLMLALYPGRAANKFGLLIGSIVSVDSTNLVLLAGCAVLVIVTLVVCYRPLLFANADPEVAAARGVPVRLLSPVFAVMIGLSTALAVPAVGAVLVLAVMVTPGAAAVRVSANPVVVTILAVLFAELSLVGGTVLSLGPGLPISGYVATLIFLCYLGCRLFARFRRPPPRALSPAPALSAPAPLAAATVLPTPRLATLPHRHSGDGQGRDRVGPGPAEQAVEQQPDEQDAGQVAAQECLLGVGDGTARTELTPSAPLGGRQQGHDQQRHRGEPDPDAGRQRFDVAEQRPQGLDGEVAREG
jgi:zinc/manganese transport system permease protein